MLFSDMFPGTYLKSADFDGGPKTLTIARIAVEDIGNNETKPVLHFAETQQGLVLNKTNGSNLAENPNFGPDTNYWIGKQVLIQAERTTFQGRPVMGIRVYPAPMQSGGQPGLSGVPQVAPGVPQMPPGQPPMPPGLPQVAPSGPYPPAAAPATPGQAYPPVAPPGQPQPAAGPLPQPSGVAPAPQVQPGGTPPVPQAQPQPGVPPAWAK